ncbi:MAG: hypothetical protein AAF843_08855 [Bacteroidota bacterium]
MQKIVLGAWFVLLVSSLSAQDVSISRNSEVMDSTKFSSLIKRYEQIIMADREELALFKIDLLGPLLYALAAEDSAKSNIARISFEKKFKPEWSWIITTEIQANRLDITELRQRAGARYYFNMQKRILKGKSANNFSANYLSARLNYKRRPVENENQVSIDLLFGIQRRLWKYGYIDFDIGIENIIVPYESKSAGIDFTSSIQIGIAF